MTDSFWSRLSGTKTQTPQQPEIRPEEIAAAKTIAAEQGWEAAYQATGISPGAAVIAASQQAVAEKPTPEFIAGLGLSQHAGAGEDPRPWSATLQRELAGIRHRLSRVLAQASGVDLTPLERERIDDELTRIRDLLE